MNKKLPKWGIFDHFDLIFLYIRDSKMPIFEDDNKLFMGDLSFVIVISVCFNQWLRYLPYYFDLLIWF